jgi:hypothetical protein
MSNNAARGRNVVKAQTSNKRMYGYVIERGKIVYNVLVKLSIFQPVIHASQQKKEDHRTSLKC